MIMPHMMELSHNNGTCDTIEHVQFSTPEKRAQKVAPFWVAVTCIMQHGTRSYMPVTGDYLVVRLLVISSIHHVL